MEKTKILFLCVHNSCRSQMAEALAKKYGSDRLEVYSAGTEVKDQINQDAVRLMKEIYDIDMEARQAPKLIDQVPQVDVIITMGCNVTCPVLPYEYETEDWGLDDPSGQADDEFMKVIEEIDRRVQALIAGLKK